MLILGVVASGTLLYMPTAFFRGTDSPNVMVFLFSGFIGIGVTALLFKQLFALGLGFGRSALVLALGYNVLIALVKLVLAPLSLYLANQHQVFDVSFVGDPNAMPYYIFIGLMIMGLYTLIFWLLYRYFKRLFTLHRLDLKNQSKKDRGRAGRVILLLSLLIVAVVVVGGSVYLMIPLFVGAAALVYVTYVFLGIGSIIALALIAALIMAYRAFAEVEKQAVKVGDASLLASFFWVGLSMILLYHVMWVVFMAALVTTWPFKTYTPK